MLVGRGDQTGLSAAPPISLSFMLGL